MFDINLDLVKKYDRPGPRYTSYPTAPQFNESFIADTYLNEIIRTNNEDNPPDLSLYYHLPFCDTLCYFCGCNMIISRNRERIHKYIEYVKNEIEDPRRIVTTTVKVKNGEHPLVPVWTADPIPKDKIFDLVKMLRKIKLNAPVNPDDIVLKNIFNTEINVLASGKVKELINIQQLQ